jgi:hypothetical protein
MKFLFLLVLATIFLTEKTSAQTPSAPDYSKLENWAASPYKMDTSDKMPDGLDDEQADKKPMCFSSIQHPILMNRTPPTGMHGSQMKR